MCEKSLFLSNPWAARRRRREELFFPNYHGRSLISFHLSYLSKNKIYFVNILPKNKIKSFNNICSERNPFDSNTIRNVIPNLFLEN